MAAPVERREENGSTASLLEIVERLRAGDPVHFDAETPTLQGVNTAAGTLAFRLAEGKGYENALKMLESVLAAGAPMRPLLRIGAAVGVWPHFASQYYGPSQPAARRAEARGRLCAIQKLLYKDVRAVLEWMAISFRSREAGTGQGFDWEERGRWRPVELLGTAAGRVDLCAVDYLLREMLHLDDAESDVRTAHREIHSQAVGGAAVVDATAACQAAFQKLGVAQITVFFPDPSVSESDPTSALNELVFVSKQEDDALPDSLLPFHERQNGIWIADPGRWDFRRLCHLIFSRSWESEDKDFKRQRHATLTAIKDTNVLPAGLSTFEYLTGQGDERWFARGLGELPEGSIPDWSDASWWQPTTREDLWKHLCPGPDLDLFRNHHTAALWDYLASHSTPPEFHGSAEEMLVQTAKQREQRPQFGYLLELLLRREFETRTSFFFALARAGALAEKADEAKGPITQFIGGSFLGLERPGIPFSNDRFNEICDRLRPLILALGHFTTRRATHRLAMQARRREESHEQRVESILRLLDGSDGKFGRGGLMLFCSRSPHTGSAGDHEPEYPEPSRKQIVSLLKPHCALTTTQWEQWKPGQRGPIGDACDDTWKALFEVSSVPKIDNLKSFLERGSETFPALSAKPVACLECFKGVLMYLLQDVLEPGQIEVERKSHQVFDLPARPGIRFAIALASFVRTVKVGAQVSCIKVTPGEAIIQFDNLPEGLFESWSRINMTGAVQNRQTPGVRSEALLQLRHCRPFEAAAFDGPLASWSRFLTDPLFATPLAVGLLRDRVWVRWPHNEK